MKSNLIFVFYIYFPIPLWLLRRYVFAIMEAIVHIAEKSKEFMPIQRKITRVTHEPVRENFISNLKDDRKNDEIRCWINA